MPPSLIPIIGRLQEVPLPTLLHSLKVEKKTGILSVQNEKVKKTIHFHEGNILFATSSDPNDDLRIILLVAGKMNFKQYELSEEFLRKSDQKEGAVLIEQGLIKPKDLLDTLALQIRQMILGLFCWESGHYNLLEMTHPPEEAIGMTIDADEILREGVLSIANWHQLLRYLPPLDAILKQNHECPPLEYLVSSPMEKEVFGLIDDHRSISDLLMLSSVHVLAWARIINVFMATGLLSYRILNIDRYEEKKLLPGKKARADQGTGRDPAKEQKEWSKTEKGEESPEIRIKKIHDVYHKIASQNYYEILGVTSDADSGEIKRSYLQLAKQYHPDRYIGDVFFEVIEEAKEIFIHIKQAYGTLSIDLERNRYDEKLKRPKQAASSDTEQKEATAAHFLNQAEMAFLQNDIKNALYFFEETIRLMPEGPKKAPVYFRYGQVLSNVPGQLHLAADALQKCVNLDGVDSRPYVELGLIFSKAGLTHKAIAAFNEVLKRDPNNLVAKQEIDKLKAKKKR
jgi:curved DNA-binding protein CbpA